MMIGPETFANMHKGESYEELIAARDELMAEIKAFENGEIPEEEYLIMPSPDTKYWCHLEYMIEICKLVEAAYREKKYKEDEEEEEDL